MLVLAIVIGAVGLVVARLILSSYPNKPLDLVSYLIKPGVAKDSVHDVDLTQLYSTIRQLLNSTKSRPFKPQPRVIFEAVFSSKNGTYFIVSAPENLIHIIKNQLMASNARLSIYKAQPNKLLIPSSNKPSVITSWRVAQDSKMQDQGVVSLLGTNLHGLLLKNNEYVNWRVSIVSDRTFFGQKFSKTFLIAIVNVIKIVLSLIRELIENDPVAARQRANNRSVIDKNIRKLKTDDRLGLRVDISSLVVTKSYQRISQLCLAVEAAARLSLIKPTKSFSSLSKIQSFKSYELIAPSPLESLDILGQLFALPLANGIWEEDSELNFSIELPAGRVRDPKPEVVLGVSKDQVVGLSQLERAKHTLVLGGTGMGKSTLLGYSIIQDIANNKGVAVIDPHGDLAGMLLKYISPSRSDDVIYLNPAQINYPVALNLMELPSQVSGPELAIAKDFIAEAIVSIFRKVFSDDDSGGHRIEYILRNAIYTAFSVPEATLLTLHKILTDDAYRSGIVASLNDVPLKKFWLEEYNKSGSFQRIKMISGVTAKLGRFQRSASVAGIINQPKSTIDFLKIIDEGKILICNLAKGNLGEDNSTLLGMVVLSKLQLAAISRAIRLNGQRSVFYLYVDEFEQFNAPIFSQMISESRKFGMSLTLAEQTTAYQSNKESNILLANVGNVISFRTAADIDMKRVLPLFKPYLSGFDLTNLEPYKFYLKAAGESAKRPVSAQTIVLRGTGNLRTADNIIKLSHQKYSVMSLS